MKYRVKNFEYSLPNKLQYKVKEWIESREHIIIQSINIWYDAGADFNYATITYQEVDYVG